jgi:hypothetical protein
MNRRDFVSIDHMRAGHSSHKASSSRCSIGFKAECTCGDGDANRGTCLLGLQTVRGQKGIIAGYSGSESKLNTEKNMFIRHLILHK